MNYCPQCRAPLPPGARFCAWCASPVGMMRPVPTASVTPKNSNIKGFAILVGIILVGSFLALIGSGNQDSSNNSKSAVPDTAAASKMKTDANKFMATVKGIDPGGIMVIRAVPEPNGLDSLNVTVTNNFVDLPYQHRLQMCQNIAKIWSATHCPNEAGGAELSLRDINDNEIGGRTIMSGSWVQKEN